MNELTKMMKDEAAPALREVETSELQAVVGGYDPDNWCGFHPPGWHPPVLGNPPRRVACQ
jgi:hypothetical protein